MPLLGAALLLAGCAIGASSTYPADASPVRAAADPPDRFVAVSPNSDSVTSAPGCHGPLRDPRDGTVIRLVASQGGRVGDYSVPPGRYGVREGELLRIQCPSGKPLGVVPGSAR
jgi:hypothetical protein